MDDRRFDTLTKTLGRRPHRRDVLGGGVSAVLTLLLGAPRAKAQPNERVPACVQLCEGLPPGRQRAECIRTARGQDVTCPENCMATLTVEGECICVNQGIEAARFYRCETDADCRPAATCDQLRGRCRDADIPCTADAECASLGTCRDGLCGGRCSSAECAQHFGPTSVCLFTGIGCSRACGTV
jgi:hypothetical protein